MNIFIRELRAHWKSFLAWSGAMVFLVGAGMMKYSAFAKTGESINDLFAGMPDGVLKVLGMEKALDLTSVGVFYSIFYLYFVLLMSVHASMMGATIIAKEERDKTADFLLVKPIWRHQAVTPKLSAALLMILLYNQITFISSALFVAPFNHTGESLTWPIFRLCVALFLVQLLFLSIGLFLGAWARSAEKASGIVTGIILGTFILKILIDLKESLDVLDIFTPFRYFISIDVMYEGELRSRYVMLCFLVSALAISGTYLIYKKRDLRC